MSEAAQMLEKWASYFVIVGSSAGALTGLQFVVLTLIAEVETERIRTEAIAAFGSPNVVHFCAALLISAIFSAPWGSLGPAGVACAASGGIGLLYSLAVLRRALKQRDYKPVLEDWVWHTILPLLAYATLLHAGIALQQETPDTLFLVGAASLLLVFVGIHNAWDTVMYVTSAMRPAPKPTLAPLPPAAAGNPPQGAGQ